MAFSNWFSATNSVLQLAQLPVIASTTVFDSGVLTKYQNAAKYKIDFANRHLALKVQTTMSNRKFTITTTAGTQAYALNTGILSENLKYHSWYNITAGSPYYGPLKLVKYEDYMDMWADQTIVQQGPPLYMVQVPYDGTTDTPALGLNPMIWCYPIPDAVYTLQYQAHLNYNPLTASGSLISWPPQYEHGLWSWAWKFLEIDLAEGREQMLDALVDDVVTRIKVASQTAEEVRKGVRMLKLSGRRGQRGGGYFGY
jgi:hypothetical protein